ncbi:unnamed protein product [Camellia sinensis]
MIISRCCNSDSRLYLTVGASFQPRDPDTLELMCADQHRRQPLCNVTALLRRHLRRRPRLPSVARCWLHSAATSPLTHCRPVLAVVLVPATYIAHSTRCVWSPTLLRNHCCFWPRSSNADHTHLCTQRNMCGLA